MTLHETINRINALAFNERGISSILADDILRLNDAPATSYAAFCAVQGNHSLSASGDLMTYNFYLYYVDRIVREDDGTNQSEIHSAGLLLLSNIIRGIREWADVPEVSFTPFLERFKDDCAGVYATIAITVSADYNCFAD